jgi:hypothetical protein
MTIQLLDVISLIECRTHKTLVDILGPLGDKAHLDQGTAYARGG